MESLRERAGRLGSRELQLLAERAEERAEWARNEERTRIAREMHDVVAHRVSLMVVHAAALQAVARKDPEKAVKNAVLVGDMGRQALTELREMLGVLRTGRVVVRAGAGRCRWRPWGRRLRWRPRGRSMMGPRGRSSAELDELVGQSAAADGGGSRWRVTPGGMRGLSRRRTGRSSGGSDQRAQQCGG